MRVWDLHCDTPFELYKQGQDLTQNGLHISLSRAEKFETYAQVMAIWTEHRLDYEDAWQQFLAIREDLTRKIPPERAKLCRTAAEYRETVSKGKSPLFLAVEGANLLCGKLERLDALYAYGVRFLTLVWKDAGPIGGAYNTALPLTSFGREVVKRCFSLGICVDVSHASDAVITECLALARAENRPILATHSNARAVCRHPRNLTDEKAREIAEVGGIIGISMAPMHLEASGNADLASVCRHICHYLDIGLARHIALGCDFDGITSLPKEIGNLSDLEGLYEALLASGISEATASDIFFGNAERFILKNLCK